MIVVAAVGDDVRLGDQVQAVRRIVDVCCMARARRWILAHRTVALASELWWFMDQKACQMPQNGRISCRGRTWGSRGRSWPVPRR
jgi:hypothetical protein